MFNAFHARKLYLRSRLALRAFGMTSLAPTEAHTDCVNLAITLKKRGISVKFAAKLTLVMVERPLSSAIFATNGSTLSVITLTKRPSNSSRKRNTSALYAENNDCN